MGAIAYALSVSHFVNSVGAKAGFAAIIAVALLVLLFFAQMRETASLRERAAGSDERVQQLEQRVAQLSHGIAAANAGAPAVVPAPAGVSRAPVVPAPAGLAPAAAAAAAGAVASRTVQPSIPSAPAGVGAPALSSATRLIPSGDESPISIRATGTSVAAPVAAGVAAGAVAAAASGGSGSGGVAAPPGPRPATAAGGANGGPATHPPAPIPAPAPPPASARPAQPQRPPVRNGAARQPLTASRPAGSGSSSRVRAALMIAAGVAVVAVVVIVLLNATSGGTSTSSSSAASSSGHRSHHGARANVPLKPADVSVTVLNGTLTTNLAHDITQRLAGSGYRTGTPATATDHTVSSTVVGYRGHGNRAAALLVARSLKLGPASVQPVGQSNLAVACPQTSTCTAQVIVTVGADLASAAGTATSAAST
jgi:LytR cell envelope-related transcriptional attenuator